MPRIVMLNGAFGAGKTTLAHALVERLPHALLYDPEEVGALLWRLLPGPRGDFQEIPAWPPLVVETARVFVETTGRSLVVPMTLPEIDRLETIRRGFSSIAPTSHFTLLASPETIARRLTERGSDRWAFDQIPRCAVLARPEFAVHLNAERSVDALATDVLAQTASRL